MQEAGQDVKNGDLSLGCQAMPLSYRMIERHANAKNKAKVVTNEQGGVKALPISQPVESLIVPITINLPK